MFSTSNALQHCPHLAGFFIAFACDVLTCTDWSPCNAQPQQVSAAPYRLPGRPSRMLQSIVHAWLQATPDVSPPTAADSWRTIRIPRWPNLHSSLITSASTAPPATTRTQGLKRHTPAPPVASHRHASGPQRGHDVDISSKKPAVWRVVVG